ncbi:hypothetical protein COV20_04795 [Candidatus Woesearchaeota archaeon CG10_big_fil_rev_8_21_14_0_10_45_16]|nr:MAG: hypothetical protein COV20_04795 [Candidatus Woesearchaeota archaeon CG10_big_fil_rev_8_21_14_0_10_45_16]
MLFYTHLLLGVAMYLSLGVSGVDMLLIVLLGAILPDIDEGNSKINRWSGFIGKIATSLDRHRGFFHSIWFFAILFLLCLKFWQVKYGWALLMGYGAHLIGDGITPMGVQPLRPLSRFTLRGPFRVGGPAENVIMVVLVVFILTRLF